MKHMPWRVALSALPSHPSLPPAAERPCWKHWGSLASERHSEPDLSLGQHAQRASEKEKNPLCLPLCWLANYCEESSIQKDKSSTSRRSRKNVDTLSQDNSEKMPKQLSCLLLMAIRKSSSSFASWIPQQFLPFTRMALTGRNSPNIWSLGTLLRNKLVMGHKGNPVWGEFAWILVSTIQQSCKLIREAVTCSQVEGQKGGGNSSLSCSFWLLCNFYSLGTYTQK